jgi:chromosome segregation ATPase
VAEQLQKAEAASEEALAKLRSELAGARAAQSSAEAGADELRKALAERDERETAQAAEMARIGEELQASREAGEKMRRRGESDRAALAQARAAMAALSKQLEEAAAEPVE